MSLWNKLPLELFGAVWVPDRFYGLQSMWEWKRADGYERREIRTSIAWAMADEMAMANAMNHFWRWWIATDRLDALRDGRIMHPWKLSSDIWETVGLGATENFVAPWPWVWENKRDLKPDDPWPWPRWDSKGR